MSIDPSAWQLLNTTYASLGIVPVIGAGASAASGLPNWETLLLRIGRRLLPDTGERLIKELRKEGFSLPAVAGMLRPFCGESDFAEIVREALYRDLPLAMRETDGLCDGFVDHMRANTTLRALGAICAVEASGQPQFECNPRIHAVVTFNLDPLLRRYVQARYDRRLLRTVERPSKERNPGKINIYYMHGFLRFDARAGERNAEASDKLVLAEQEYFDFFNNPTGLFNYTFLHLLREHSCLFVGLSMQDDNIRRLLHYSCKERVAALRDEGKDLGSASEIARRHFAILLEPREPLTQSAIEQALLRLGVRTLWISSFEQIPERLGEMYAAGGGRWEAVY